MQLASLRPLRNSLCLGGALVGSMSMALAQDAAKLDKLEKENADLRKRLEVLEGVAQKEGILPTDGKKPQLVKALSEISLSGFVQASYFYDTSTPSDGVSNAYLWNATHNSFSINKVKVTLASQPVERSGDSWDAGFRTSLIWGEDSPNLNTGSPMAGFEALREAYVELNAPLGSGLNIKAGQLISLLNYESGDGGAVNANFSQGNQWWYTGNGPAAGVQLGYNFTDEIDLKVRAQNGMFAGPVDSNDGKALVASLGFKPNDKFWANLIGWYSAESDPTDVMGGSVIGGIQVTQPFGIGYEFDYFHFDNKGVSDADLWSIGTWLTYDFNPKVGLAFRGDYVKNPDGVLGPPMRGASSAIITPDSDGSVASLTLTLNYRPAPNVRIQPEIRYDHTSYKDGFDSKEDRFIVGAGISYLF